MRILQLTKSYPPDLGGIESVTFDLTEGINKRGLVCDVLCANNGNRTIKENRGTYRIIRAASLGKVWSASVAPVLVYYLWKWRKAYDIIHLHTPDPMNMLAFFLVRPKAKLVVHWHSDIVKQKKAFFFFLPLQNWILKRADVVVGTTEKYIAHSTQLRNFRPKSVAIPIGIDAGERFEEGGVKEIRDRHRGKKIVFSLGRLVYYKGFEYLIEAGTFLEEDIVVLIGGAGKLEGKLKGQIEALGLGDRVILLGRIPAAELENYFKASDVFCLPSIAVSEAFGVVMLEAMKYGRPIVATDIPLSGVGWVNAHGVTGLNVVVKNAHALAGAINELTRGDLFYTSCSANAKKRFLEFFVSDKMVSAFLELYRSITE